MSTPATTRAIDALVEAAELAHRLGVLTLALNELAEWADDQDAALILDDWATERIIERGRD